MGHRPPNILVTSVSAKIALVKAFTELPRGRRGRVVGVDVDPHAPAARACDAFYVVPADADPDYTACIQKIVQQEQIGLVVPTREAELLYWSKYAAKLSVATASVECLNLTLDKWQTCYLLVKHGLPTPASLQISAAVAAFKQQQFPLPWIAKDPFGAGADGILLVTTEMQIPSIPDNWLVQPRLAGKEYTINLYVDRTGRCCCIIPHRRDKIVGGQVHRGQTVNEPVLIALAQKLVDVLPPIYGPFNFQVFWQGGDAPPYIIDINPRFGGGYLLCHAAGGRFAHWLVEEAAGHSLGMHDFTWRANVSLDRDREPVIF